MMTSEERAIDFLERKNNGLVPDNIFMSARLQVATQLMAGLLSGISKSQHWTATGVSLIALECADELIALEKKKQ